jgi:hypothetical protein
MSSATSTKAEVGQVRVKPDTASREGGANTFRASHFFVLASLVAATGAVIVSRQSTPEHLVLISLTIASAGLAAAGFYRVMSPFVGDASPTLAEPLSERARHALEREKALALRSIKDLEFDRAMGKLSQADFDEMSARQRARALGLMKQLDQDASGYRSIIEHELSARLAAQKAERQAQPVAPPAAAAPAGVCACGTTNDPDALFCKRCGTKLAGSVETDRAR